MEEQFDKKILIPSSDVINFLTKGLLSNLLKPFHTENFGVMFLKGASIQGTFNLIENNVLKIVRSIEFIDCVFDDWVSFNCVKVETSIGFMRCSFEKSIIVHDGNYKYGLRFNDCSIKQTIQINDGTFSDLELEFTGEATEGGIVIIRGTFNKLKIQKCVLERISINLEETKGHIIIDESKFGLLGINGKLSIESELTISNLKCRYFELKKFQNFGKLEIFRLRCDPSLPIRKIKEQKWSMFPTNSREFLRYYLTKPSFILFQSSIGNASINNIDFSDFDFVVIKDSNISQVNFNNIKWFKKIEVFYLKEHSQEILEKIKGGNICDDEKDYSEKKEIYRQLKLASNRQNDIINEQYFHGLEMRSYYKTLQWFSKDFFTKSIIGLSLLTSDFGQSISRPIACLLLGHFLLFALVLFFNGFYPLHFSLDKYSLDGFEDGFEKYCIYINPFRKTDLSFSGYLIVIDLIMRIWSSFMIYNIIRASRRFIK